MYENLFLRCQSIRKHIHQEASRTKTWNASQTYSITQILYTEKYNHNVWNGTNIYKSKRKGISRAAILKNFSTCKPIRKLVYQETNCTKTCIASQPCSETQIFVSKTFKYSRIYTKVYKGRGRVYENISSTWSFFRKPRGQVTSCTNRCNVSQTYSWTNKLCIQMYNHDAFCMITHKYLPIYTTKYKSRGHLYENIISNRRDYSKAYMWIYQPYKNMPRVTGVFGNTNSL